MKNNSTHALRLGLPQHRHNGVHRSALPHTNSTLFSLPAWAAIHRTLALTDRELEIVQAVFDGASEQAISRSLGLSPHTVHTHLRRLYLKLQVQDRVALVLAIIREFLALTTRTPSVLPPLCSRYAIGLCPAARNQFC